MSIETAELTIEQRVAAGAAWLDENRPGWLDLIDLEQLDLEYCAACVLGQIFGDYRDAPAAAKWASEFRMKQDRLAPGRGFDVDAEDEGYDELTAEWRRLIESRRAAVE